MFRPYRTLKLKVPRPCCPWCQAYSDRIEQRLQATEAQILELSSRLRTKEEADNVQAGFLTALQVFGLNSSRHPTDEDPQPESLLLARALSAITTALDRLAEASAGPAPPSAISVNPKLLSPHPLPQIAAPQNGSGQPFD